METKVMSEMMDAWMKAQKEFADNLMKVQKEGVDRWVEAAASMRESFEGFNLPDGPMKEARNFTASLITVAADSVKAFAEDSARIQETVKAGMERQAGVAREVAERFAGLFPAAAPAK